MTTEIGYGTTFEWDGDLVGYLTRVGPVSVTISKQDSTILTAANAFKTILPGLLDPGDVELEGWFRPDDTGQAGMLADMLSRTVKGFIITFPTAISSTTWTGNAYVTEFVAGDATPEGIVPWTAKISITGKPTLGVTAAADATTIELVGDVTANMVEVPTFAGATYEYTVIGAADNTFTIEVTAAGADNITLNVDGGADIALATGVPSAAIETQPADIVVCVIRVQENLKSPKTYTVRVTDGL